MLRRAIWIGLLFSLALTIAHAGQWAYLNSEVIYPTTTTIGFTNAKISPSGQQQATRATCSLDTADIRYTIDIVPPTSAYGIYVSAGSSPFTIVGHDALVNFRTILATSTTGAKLYCLYSAP